MCKSLPEGHNWLPLKGYEGLYSISDRGVVWAHASGTFKGQSGGDRRESRYKYVTLYRENIGVKYTVHRLVGLHFVKNPNGHPYVLHKNDDRQNNSAANLKWGTQKQNIADAIRNGKDLRPKNPCKGMDQKNAKLTPDKVRKIREIRDSGVWVSQESLSARFGISRGTLRSVLADKHWKHVI